VETRDQREVDRHQSIVQSGGSPQAMPKKCRKKRGGRCPAIPTDKKEIPRQVSKRNSPKHFVVDDPRHSAADNDPTVLVDEPSSDRIYERSEKGKREDTFGGWGSGGRHNSVDSWGKVL